MTDLIGIGFVTRRGVRREHITTCDLDAILKEDVEDNFGSRLRNDLVTHVFLEARKRPMSKTQDRLSVLAVKNKRVGATFHFRVLFQRDLFDRAAKVGEVHFDKIVGE